MDISNVSSVRELIRGVTGFNMEVREVAKGSTRGQVIIINLSSTKMRAGNTQMMEVVYEDGKTELIDRITFLRLESKLGA